MCTYCRRDPGAQELFSDPVILSQTGYTYDRPAIERWLRQKSPPTDPSTNVELYTTETVPNWALRDAANEWCATHALKPLQVGTAAGSGVPKKREKKEKKPKKIRNDCFRRVSQSSPSSTNRT